MGTVYTLLYPDLIPPRCIDNIYPCSGAEDNIVASWRKTGVVLSLVQEDCTTNGSSGATAVPVPRRKKIVLVLYNPGLTWIRRRPCTLWNCEHEAVLLLQSWVIHRCVYISYTAVPLLYTVLAILTILYSNIFRT